MKKVGIIGSSGGNLYNLGGKDPKKMIEEIQIQIAAAGLILEDVEFVASSSTMDNKNNEVSAKFCYWDKKNDTLVFSNEKKLKDINEEAIKYDEKFAKKILNGEIDGLIVMSCDPRLVNKKSIEAATIKKIPIVGTGGTSMALINSMGANVISTSGTTGTTNRTRAVAAISSLAKLWKIKYSPIIGGKREGVLEDKNILSRISIRGIMMASIPGFITMALVLAASKIPYLGGLNEIFEILIKALPIIVATLAAKQVSGLDEVGIVSGIVAGVLSVNGGIIGGMVGGILAGIFCFYLIKLCFYYNFPATTANIVAGGISGLVSGLIVYFLLAPIALKLGDSLRMIIEYSLNISPILAGGIAGLLIWPAIIGGVYHAAILPIVLLEMEKTGNSFLGAIDMTGLVMVSVGITLANVIFPRNKSDRAIATPGFLINVLFGTFVEASYPFMFSDKIVMIGAMFSGALSGLVVGAYNLRGTAYVPSIVAPMMSNNIIGFIISMFVAFGSAFIVTGFANKLAINKKEKKKKEKLILEGVN